MQERGWLLGGENSGHIICLDKHTTGDGIIAALQVLAALRANGETLAEACADLTMYPQKLINVRMPAGFDWKSDHGIEAAAQAGGSGARRQRARAAAAFGHRAAAARDGRGQRRPTGHGSGGKHRRGGARSRRRLTGGRQAPIRKGCPASALPAVPPHAPRRRCRGRSCGWCAAPRWAACRRGWRGP